MRPEKIYSKGFLLLNKKKQQQMKQRRNQFIYLNSHILTLNVFKKMKHNQRG